MEKQALTLSSPSMADTQHTSFFLSCLFMKEARPMKKWAFSDTQHQLFFPIRIYERGKTHGKISIFDSHPDTQHQLSYFMPVYERGKPHGADSQAHPSHTPFFFSMPVYEISKTHREMGPRDSPSQAHPRHTKPA